MPFNNTFGKNIKVTIFGASHAPEVGVEIIGLPKDIEIDKNKLQKFLNRRKPGENEFSSARIEPDIPEIEILEGLYEDAICLRAVIKNTDIQSNDYANFKNTPRPGHADYTAYVKDPNIDMTGGGPFSGRLTAPLCVAGGICKDYLEKQGIYIGAHISSIGIIDDDQFPLFPPRKLFEKIATKNLPVINEEIELLMAETIHKAAKDGDSVGGTIECAVIGLPAGLGNPMFDGVENRIAHAIFGIPAVKGIEFGSGFMGSTLNGSKNNDAFEIKNGKVQTKTNNHGGALGGITSGMPVKFRVAMKPTPSIAKEQNTVNLKTMKNTKIRIDGRHDPCIVPRSVPIIEAVTAIVILDMLFDERC
ncbi:MAG: chorismate synthase [Ruminococcaceae bacterium]|nr:chorismate synthase [Oscillospiraceae bacterium]